MTEQADKSKEFRCKNNFTSFLDYNYCFLYHIDLFMAYKYPSFDVFHWFCKTARFFAMEPSMHKQTIILVF